MLQVLGFGRAVGRHRDALTRHSGLCSVPSWVRSPGNPALLSHILSSASPFSSLSLSFPICITVPVLQCPVSREREATLGPPQFLPSPHCPRAGSSMILNVVSWKIKRLTFFRLPWLLLVLVLGRGQARASLASVSRASPWVRGNLF